MNRIVVAQRLVDIADELDSLGLVAEANEVDSIVRAMSDGGMQRSAQTATRGIWDPRLTSPSQSASGYITGIPGKIADTIGSLPEDLVNWSREQIGGRLGLSDASRGAAGEVGVIRTQIDHVDREIEKARNTLMYLQQQKANLMQKGQEAKKEMGQSKGQGGMDYNPYLASQYVHSPYTTQGLKTPPAPSFNQ